MTPVEFRFSSFRSNPNVPKKYLNLGLAPVTQQSPHHSWKRFPCLWAGEGSWGMEIITALPKHNWKYVLRQRTVWLLKFFLPTPGVCWIRHNTHWGGTGRPTGNVEEHSWEGATAWHHHDKQPWVHSSWDSCDPWAMTRHVWKQFQSCPAPWFGRHVI